MKIEDIPIGATVRVTTLLGGTAEYRQRLLVLGIIPGAIFKLERIAPLGDPVEIKVRGSHVGLRKEEACILDLEPMR